MATRYFEIGPLHLRVDDPEGLWGNELPPNFTPFLSDEPADGEYATALITTDEAWPIPDAQPLSEAFNDVGITKLYRTDRGWLVSIATDPRQPVRLMLMAPDFRSGELRLPSGETNAPFFIDSMLRILFSQYATTRGALLIHASSVELDGVAHIFMGRSGTGKSTHSRLWMNCFEEARMVNDDVPLIVAPSEGSAPRVCGTPWSGKGRVWRRCSLPLRGIVRLQQSPDDTFTPLSDIDAFIAVLPGVSVMTADHDLYAAATNTVLSIIGHSATVTGTLRCTPCPSAAILCRGNVQ